MPIASTNKPVPRWTDDVTCVRPVDKELRRSGDTIYMARLTPSGVQWNELVTETWLPKKKVAPKKKAAKKTPKKKASSKVTEVTKEVESTKVESTDEVTNLKEDTSSKEE